jgi:nitroreductase
MMCGNAFPQHEVLARALSAASRAPSVANSQPWLWRINRDGLELFADANHRLVRSDPDARSMLLSCGTALHHVQVAMAAQDWASVVTRLPDDRVPGLLASIEFAPAPASAHDVALAAAIEARWSDRRPMSSWQVPHEQVRHLVAVAAAHGGFLEPLDPLQAAQWARLSSEVQDRRLGDPAVERELAPVDPGVLSWGATDAEIGLLLATTSDDRMAELRAGEALSAVLLEATRLGLATRMDSQPIEVASTRARVQRDILKDHRSPQILVVVGWPADRDDLPPATSRRPADSTYRVVGSESLAHQLDRG